MKNSYIIILIMLFGVEAFAQNPASMQSSFETKVKSTVWQLLANNEFIDINYKYGECNLPSQGTHDEFVYLQIKNKTNKELKIEWNTEYWYNEKCYGCEDGNTENHKTIHLIPNTTIEGICAEDVNPALVILSRMLNIKINTELTNFNLREIKTTIVK